MRGGRQRTLPQAWWAAGGKTAQKDKKKGEANKAEEEKEEERDDDLLLVEAAAAADPGPAAGLCSTATAAPGPAAGLCSTATAAPGSAAGLCSTATAAPGPAAGLCSTATAAPGSAAGLCSTATAAPGPAAGLCSTATAAPGSAAGLCSTATAAPGPAAGFCAAAGSIWIYPTNYPLRAYQLRMAQAALLANTLVCLPTGLGKTFVAAVVMYNFYRWFPSGKVLFLAPTKPLVAQQMEACASVMGIPAEHMAEMTGGTQALNRRDLWTAKRVFFLTPQIMVNDLSRGTCPAVEIKCLVIDEAHKALGNHAYCQVVRELSKYTNQFRILALSATPGSDTKAVQQVISNLLIAQIEVCAEDSPEIQPYSHERQVEKIVVPLGEDVVGIQNAYIQVLETFAGRLIKIGVLARRDVPSLTKYQIILARDQYRKNPSSQNLGIHQGVVEGDFALCISLYHGYELLLQMGLRSLFIYLCGIMDGSKGLTRTKNELGRNEGFMQLYQQLTAMFADTALPSVDGKVYKDKTAFEKKKEFIYSHPKLRKLEEIVIEHFKSWNKKCSDQGRMESMPVVAVDTRVMIFSSFRDSVQEIAEMLSRLSPVVRVMTFVGHSTGKSTKGFTQKEQLEVVKRFREGGYNTLVSTCVGEEGLDIGEVDLIICFDAQKSPIRLVQRMGRTGRRRQGRIVVILAEGREERTYNQSQLNKRSIHKAISGNKMLHFYQHSPRMIPEGINPKLHKMFITAEKYEPSNSTVLSKERRSSSLQHKSLFSCVTGQKQLQHHEKWALSPEEFELWDRVYRIKEDDGLKEPVLPQSQFETLENLEEMPKHQVEASHELSLSEWSVWQNHPFPTSMVDHSDRCYHFISIMEMIELLRHEQGDCSYDLEMQPHLQMGDVHVRRRKSHLASSSSELDQRACPSGKGTAHGARGKPASLGRNDDGSELFATFKVTKALRRSSGLDGDLPLLPSDANGSASSSATQLPAVESTEQGSQEDEKLEVTFDLNESFDLCDNSESPGIPESAARKECRAVAKACRSLGTTHADSGYGSFTAEKSPLSSNLFYLPESYLDSFALVRPAEEPSWVKNTSSPVKRLLAQSPPSLNHLDAIESRLSNEETPQPLQKAVPGSSSDRLQAQVFPVASEADGSLLLFEHPELRVTNESCASIPVCLSQPVSAPEAKEEVPWDDSFEGLLGNEEFPEIQRTTPNHTATNNPLKKSFVQKDEDLELNKQEVRVEEKSVCSVEDECTYKANNASNSMSKKHFTSSPEPYLIIRPEAEQGPEWLPSEVSCLNADKTCKEQPTSSKPSTMEVSGDTTVAKQLLDNADLYDYSQELFSVNFELGFSIEECEDEILKEENSNTRKSTSTSGTHGDVNSKLLEDSPRLETSPKWDCRSLERRHISTPLLFQRRDVKDSEGAEDATTSVPFLESGGRRKGKGSPEALAFALSTPTRGKVLKKAPRNIFSSAKKEIPEASFAEKVNKSPHRQDCGRSAIDRLGSPLRGTENLEDINPHPLCVSPAAGPSSESEEEIVFQRKHSRKVNVLKSPDAPNDSNFESPVHAARKRRRPLDVSDRSSDDSSMDFQKSPRKTTATSSAAADRNRPRSTKRQKVKSSFPRRHAARQFLDEEAELSEEDAEVVSSDENEDTDNELSSSLAQFLNDEAEVTQVLNDCEMKGVYLKSVRSPALGTRYKMVHREFNSTAIFSQVPEQDQTYAEDSFCVGEEEEELCPKSESSEEEVSVNFDLLHNETFAGGRKQYLTRRRRRLNQARVEETCSVPLQKKKPSRIVVLTDSSGDESSSSREKPVRGDESSSSREKPVRGDESSSSSREKPVRGDESSSSREKPVRPDCLRAEQKTKPPQVLPSASSVQHERTAGDVIAQQSGKDKRDLLLGLKASGSEMLDFHPEHRGRRTGSPSTVPELGKENLQAPPEVESSLSSACRNPSVLLPSSSMKTSAAPAPFPPAPLEKPPSLCILADSREISSGAEVISSLKALHSMKVQVCSLGSGDYVVSNRLAVERMFLSELLSPASRSKVTQKIQCLQSTFERVCVIVEKDRAKAGEASRICQRTQYCDGVLAALLQAGVRILFSSCQEESAALLKDLALVEQRKNAAICVPIEVESHRREMLNFYLTIPNLSYPAALNMCHRFSSLKELANSSPMEIAAGAQVSAQKAEEIFHYLHYGFDLHMLPDNSSTKGRSNTKS
ncbi:Fanconi anemia group M protein isoform X2 [Pogoniulus pusillus]|uniref:Fanconi anemia group M protein isoform X2 n=1 Tax=Pogoniulus pusillus TaxID=488313 RepID=UPI0030B94BCA